MEGPVPFFCSTDSGFSCSARSYWERVSPRTLRALVLKVARSFGSAGN